MERFILFESHFGIVRVQMKEIIWFNAMDVLKVLGYDNFHSAIQAYVDPDDLWEEQAETMEPKLKINLSGVFSLLYGSMLDLEEMRSFKFWVNHEIIPAMYGKKIGQVEMLPADISVVHTAEVKPKPAYLDKILESCELMNSFQVATDYGKSKEWLEELLVKKGVLYIAGSEFDEGYLLPQVEYAQKGITKTVVCRNEHGFSINNLWTQKGRVFLYELLKSDGLLPKMEWTNVK